MEKARMWFDSESPTLKEEGMTRESAAISFRGTPAFEENPGLRPLSCYFPIE